MKRKIFLAICMLFGVVFVVSAVGLGVVLMRYHKAESAYEDLRELFVIPASPDDSDSSDDGTPPANPGEAKPGHNPGYNPGQTPGQNPGQTPGDDPDPTPAGTAEQNPGQNPTDTPQTDPIEKMPKDWSKVPISINFDALLKVNPDVVGWLYSEGTPIHYPVVQSSDNKDYLHTDLYGKYLYSGTLFADFRCGQIPYDQNHIIYGHTMKDGSMFGMLNRYKKQSYYDAHPSVFYLTPDHNYRIDLFAGFVTDSTSEFYSPNFGSKEAFATILQKIRAKSVFKSDVTVTEEDHIVMFSSCDYVFDNARFVVFGKLVLLS